MKLADLKIIKESNETVHSEHTFLRTSLEIARWLDARNIKNYTIGHTLDHIVNVNGNVDLSASGLFHIPVMFGEVTGSFNISNNTLLSTLKGCPAKVGKRFICYNNSALKSLEHGPISVGGNYLINGSGILSLEGAPSHIYGDFKASHCKLTSLKGGPRTVLVDYDVSGNKLLSLLDSPNVVGGDFEVSSNQITELSGITPEIHGNVFVSDNLITSFHNSHKHIKKMNGKFWLKNNPIKDSLLSLMMIPGCSQVVVTGPFANTDEKLQMLNNIMYEYSQRGKDAIFDCQNALIDAGLDDFAQL